MKEEKKVTLPEFLKPYFWDVDFSELEVEKHKFLITKRVIDRGNSRDVHWVIDTYGLDAIREVVLKTRDLSRKTAHFWALILDLDPKQVPCLQKPYSPIPFGLSS